MIDRERKIDVEKMDINQADVLQKQLSAKLTQILENAAKKLKKLKKVIFNIYQQSFS